MSLFLRHFAERRELIITVEAPTPEAAEATADAIAVRLNAMPRQVTRAVARPPWEQQPAQLAEIIAFLAFNQPPEKAREIAARLSPEHAPQTLRETVERMGDSLSPQEIGLLGYDPFDLTGTAAGSLLNSGAQASEFASADGRFHVVYVESAVSFENYNHAVAWIDAIHRATAEWQGKNGVHLGYTGEPAIVASIAQSMQRDMQSSGVVTLLVIALLFWFCYRRFRPLLELQAMLLLIFTLTLAIAGWAFDQLTVIGVGSSAILIGLSVDYGYFVYQRAQHFRGPLRELQRQCVRYIVWTAGTTAAAFFALNVSSLPGLSQLGNLVGVGVVVGAVVMLGVFAPLAWRRAQREGERPPTFVERLVVSPRFHRARGVADGGGGHSFPGRAGVEGLAGRGFFGEAAAAPAQRRLRNARPHGAKAHRPGGPAQPRRGGRQRGRRAGTACARPKPNSPPRRHAATSAAFARR